MLSNLTHTRKKKNHESIQLKDQNQMLKLNLFLLLIKLFSNNKRYKWRSVLTIQDNLVPCDNHWSHKSAIKKKVITAKVEKEAQTKTELKHEANVVFLLN